MIGTIAIDNVVARERLPSHPHGIDKTVTDGTVLSVPGSLAWPNRVGKWVRHSMLRETVELANVLLKRRACKMFEFLSSQYARLFSRFPHLASWHPHGRTRRQ